jgi:flagellar motor component MotA
MKTVGIICILLGLILFINIVVLGVFTESVPFGVISDAFLLFIIGTIILGISKISKGVEHLINDLIFFRQVFVNKEWKDK